MITEIEQATSDIDWFFTNGKNVAFVASCGGKLPQPVASKSIEEIELLTTFFRELKPTSAATFSPEIIGTITSNTNLKGDLSYFVEMAEKGLFAFDKTVTNRFSDTRYHLVAKPLTPLKLKDLPIEIAKMLIGIKIDGDINETLDIASMTFTNI
jgi:hypothetical protein